MSQVFHDSILMIRNYLKGNYPPFIYSDKYQENYLPAFFYHNIDSFEFEDHLKFLHENHYETLSCSEAIERLRHKNSHDQKQVLLTFDDGLPSLYTEVFPLLLNYRMKVVAYIVPAWIGQPGFLTWEQCREMYETKLVDFQSHSYAHSKIVTRLVIKNIWLKARAKYLPWGIPGFDARNIDFLWLPIFEGKPLFEGTSAYVLPESFWNECLEIQKQSFNPSNDLDRSQIEKLKEQCYRILKRHSDSVLKENEEGIFYAMIRDLQESKTAIEQQLPGHKVRHFAFPWFQNSACSWRALKRAGFISGAIGLKNTNKDNDNASHVLKIFRVNGDFLFCLPGKGRKTFLQTVMRKIVRRFNPKDSLKS